MAEGHTIETYGRAPHNRNIWQTGRRHAWPILLSVLLAVVIPLLVGAVLILVIILILISCLWCFYTNKCSFFCFFLCYFFLFLSPDFQQFLFPLKLFPLPFQLFRIIFFLMQNIQQTKVIEELQDLGTA